MYGLLTSFLPRMQDTDPEGLDPLERGFEMAVYKFIEAHEEMRLTRYDEILADNGISLVDETWEKADINDLDGQTVMALIVAAVRTERFCEGTLASLFKRGYIQKWVQRLHDIDQDTIDRQWCRCDT